MNNINLTAKETFLMTAIADRKFSFFDEGLVEGSGIWADCLTGEIVGSTEYPVSESRRGVASVLNSLCRKGLLISEDDDESTDGAWTYLTAAGQAWCEAHNAETAAFVAELTAESAARQDAEIVEETTVELPVVKLSGEMTEIVEDVAAVETAEVVEEAPEAPAAVEVPEAPVKWGMGTHTVGDVVISKDGIEWTVTGPAEKGKTVRLERTVDGAVKVRLSFHYNITKKA